MNRRVVVTGLGTVNALGSVVDQFWERLCAGESGIAPISAFDTTDYKVKFAGEVRNFQPDRWIDPHDAKRIDRFAQFAIGAAAIAVDDAGLDFTKEDPSACGVILGSGIGGLSEIEEQHTKLLSKGPGRVGVFMIPKLMVNAAAGQVAIRYGIKGPCSAIATACASSSNAIGDAYRLIQRGEADVIVTGGSEAAICPMGVSGFIALRALSTRNDAPQRASRPFDRDRDGFVLSEGAAVMTLEDIEHAQKRGARIYAEVIGYGMSCDGYHITAPDPEGRGAAKAMSGALRDAKLNPDAIEYINAHGTSTPLGDEAETKAIKTVFGEHARRVPVSSTKSQLGHLLGASGAIELLITILTLHRGAIPATINYENPDPACDLDYVPNTARTQSISRAMSNSFAFGGHNTSLIVSKLNGK